MPIRHNGFLLKVSEERLQRKFVRVSTRQQTDQPKMSE
jgi:hypothetical protein